MPLWHPPKFFGPTPVFKDGRLNYVSSTSLRLDRFNGNHLTINNVPQVIPAAGVTLANSGLSASTLYYIYAYMNAGVLALEGSTTAPAISSINGLRIKTGDETRTLVGMAQPDPSVAFLNSDSSRRVRTYYNDPGVVGNSSNMSGLTTGSSAWVTFGTNGVIEFLAWTGERFETHISGSCYMNVAGGAFFGVATALDTGSNILAGNVFSSPGGANFHGSNGIGQKFSPTQGYHSAYIAAHANGGTMSFNSTLMWFSLSGSGA